MNEAFGSMNLDTTNNMPPPPNNDQHPMVDEPECRVCRCVAEADHPLHRACKCRGSIGWVHQDCLQRWLDVMQSSGRSQAAMRKCELCHYRFQFEPLYAPDAPEHLAASMVVFGIARRLIRTWLPAALKIVVCLALWCGVVPLLTAHFYLSWMHKPTILYQRLSWDCLRQDWVGGMVVAASIIISFLSIMNFADFVRVEIQPPALQRRRRMRDLRRAAGAQQEHMGAIHEGNVDNELWVQAQQEILGADAANHELNVAAAGRGPEGEHKVFGTNDDDVSPDLDHSALRDYSEEDDDDDYSLSGQDDSSDDGPYVDSDHEDDDDDEQVAGVQMHAGFARLQAPVNAPNRVRFDIPANAQAGPPPPPPAPPADDGADLEMNIALDELLGVRGPLAIVVRNLLWLLAFNVIYLGFFVFTPRIVGMAASSIILNTTSVLSVGRKMVPANITQWNATMSSESSSLIDEFWQATMANISSPVDLLRAVEAQSAITKATFYLSDVVGILMGYLTCASLVLFLNFLLLAARRIAWMCAGRRRARLHGTAGAAALAAADDDVQIGDEADMEDVRDALEEFNRMLDGVEDENLRGDDQVVLDNAQRGMAIMFFLGVVLKATTAIVKVGVLLLLKMFFLPVTLGFCLDASTLALLGSSLEERIKYAGSDLFSFMLVHWVAGITFMLLVTVSVLQLREVMHPDILAQAVRPQEPQPDLLGNLLHENVLTHMKRMTMSLIVYACLLSMHVYIPIRLSMWAGFQPRLKFSFVLMPQLQVPLELLFFHLCMLGLLEKNKNIIGEMQHHWLRFMGGLLCMSDCMLPRRVSAFRLCGRRYIYKTDLELEPFWQELAGCNGKQRGKLIESAAHEFTTGMDHDLFEGATTPDGSRVLQAGCDYIRLPIRVNGRALRCRSVVIPTCIGRYRLIRGTDRGGHHIELWEEVAGAAIPRPPEGWDDLGHGGAVEQGRWAWNKEEKSIVENGVAHRSPYFRTQRNSAIAILKIIILALTSWAVTSFLLGLLVLSPLIAGRLLLRVARIPDAWIHDPFAYGLGSLFFFPVFHLLFHSIVAVEPGGNRLSVWLSRLRMPPLRKLIALITSATLFVVLAPLFVGSIVDLGIIKQTPWFMGALSWAEPTNTMLNWILGAVILMCWVQFCRFGLQIRQFLLIFALAPNPVNNRAGNNHNNPRGRGVARQGAVAPSAHANEGSDDLAAATWLGEHGRTERFISVWKTAVLNFEHDKIDPTVLLDDFCYPMIRGLSAVLFWPLFCLGAIHWRAPMIDGLLRLLVVRGVLLLSLAHQSSSLWLNQAKKLFDVARKTARDDLYLMGEVLMSYSG